MGKSKIVALVKYTSIFGRTFYITKEEAEAKLIEEQALYEKWRVQFPDKVQQPTVERAPYKRKKDKVYA